jgi:hypothetical protein
MLKFLAFIDGIFTSFFGITAIHDLAYILGTLHK